MAHRPWLALVRRSLFGMSGQTRAAVLCDALLWSSRPAHADTSANCLHIWTASVSSSCPDRTGSKLNTIRRLRTGSSRLRAEAM